MKPEHDIQHMGFRRLRAQTGGFERHHLQCRRRQTNVHLHGRTEILKPTSHSNPTGASGGRFRWLLKLAVLRVVQPVAVEPFGRLPRFASTRVVWQRVPLVFGFWSGPDCSRCVDRGAAGSRWGLSAGGFLLVLGWWFCLSPSNQRDWQPDLALLLYAEFRWQQSDHPQHPQLRVSHRNGISPHALRSDVRSRKIAAGGSVPRLLGFAAHGAYHGQLRV